MGGGCSKQSYVKDQGNVNKFKPSESPKEENKTIQEENKEVKNANARKEVAEIARVHSMRSTMLLSDYLDRVTYKLENAEKVKEEPKPKLGISDTTLNENDDAYEIADKITSRLLRKYLRNEMKLVKHEFDINTTL